MSRGATASRSSDGTMRNDATMLDGGGATNRFVDGVDDSIAVATLAAARMRSVVIGAGDDIACCDGRANADVDMDDANANGDDGIELMSDDDDDDDEWMKY